MITRPRSRVSLVLNFQIESENETSPRYQLSGYSAEGIDEGMAQKITPASFVLHTHFSGIVVNGAGRVWPFEIV